MLRHNSFGRAVRRRRERTLGGAVLLMGAGLSLAVLPTLGQEGSTKPEGKPLPLRVVPTARKKKAAGRGAGASRPSGVMPGNRSGRSAGVNPAVPPVLITPLPGIGGAAPSAPGGTKFTFDFHGSDISNVLKFYARMANVPVVTDAALTGNVTIINPQPVTLDDAFTILQQVLAVKGYTAIQKKGVISIVPFANAGKITPLLNPTVNDSGETKVDSRDMVMTQVIPVDNVDAEAMARELQPLISTGANLIGSSGTNSLVLTDTASNVQRFIALVEALDKTSNKTELRTYPLRRAEASAIADIINNLFKQISSRGRGGAPPQPGQPGFNPGQPGGPPGGAGAPAVLAVPDPRTNAVLVVASPDNQEKIADQIINRLDGDDTNTLETKIRKINFANAVDVANLVNSALSNMHGTASSSSGGNSFQQRAFQNFNPFGGGGGGSDNQQSTSSSDPFGKVMADPRTNSLLITASTDRMTKIDSLIDALDKEVPVEATTFVFPLKNALASDVAYSLSQAFNTSNDNNNNPFGGFFFGGFGGNNNNGANLNLPPKINRRLGQSSQNNGRAAKARYGAPPPPNAPDGGDQGDPNAPADNGGSAQPQGVQGVMTDQGFVPTGDGSAGQGGAMKPTRQWWRYGQQQRSLGQNGGPQYGRGRNGNFSNLLQLQNNVFVNAAPGGDSLIVTTTPDNYEAVRQLVEALDVVPRQVMIEVIVAEVSLDKDQKLGFALSGLFRKLFGANNTAQGQLNLTAPQTNSGSNGTTLDPTASGAQFVINASSYSALLQAIESDNKIKVLATPRVFVSNSQEAAVYITTQIPYVSGQLVNGGFSNVTTNQTLFQQIGYTLDVTPRITRDGLVTIDVYATASDLVRYQTLGSGSNAQLAPIFNQRVTDTEATVQDGQTVVVGGLIKDTDTLNINKVPILSEIPLLGQFFRSREKIKSKTELMIFMTPHVVTTTAEARELTRKEGAPIINQFPDLWKQQPNLDPRSRSRGGLAPKVYLPNSRP